MNLSFRQPDPVQPAPKRSRLHLTSVAALSITGLLLTGCASNTPTTQATIAEDLTTAAARKALEFAGGEKIGGTLSIVGVNGGVEGDIIKKTFKPFEDATGVTIEYQGTSDANTIVQTRVSAGDAPDIFNAANAGALPTYAKNGKLIALDDLFNKDDLKEQFSESLINSATVDGKLYGIWNEVDNFMLWYNAKTYKGPKEPQSWQELQTWAKAEASGGTTPFCMGLESGAASGVPGAHFISNLLLHKYGPDLLNQMASGKLPFTSPEVTDAFRMFGEIATSPTMVDGGPTGALTTKTTDGGNGLFSDPQRCQLLGWGNYAGGLIRAANPTVEPVKDLDFFRYPSSNPEYAKSEMVSGHVMYAFNDTPQVRAFMKYYASAEGQGLLAASGQWVVGNKNVPLDTYPNELTKKAAKQYSEAEEVVLAPVSQLPAPVVINFYKSIVAYVQNPESLDAVLQNLEKTRLEAMGS